MIIFILLLLVSLAVSEVYKYDTKYLDVPIDHFSFTTNNSVFKLRYLINDSYWEDGAPIFFYTGNEGDINMFAQNTGFMFDIAPNFNALLIFAEHRYYGLSLPFGNLSFTAPKYLGYLTTEQALRDFVSLINYLQQSLRPEEPPSPVIAFGGSYGGMLSSWFRMKYPAVVLGSIAASAPILQFTGLTSCDTYSRIVTRVYTLFSTDDCSVPIKKSWTAIRNITSTNEGRDWLSKTWNLCQNISNSKDVDTVIDWISDAISNMAMLNYPYASSFLLPLPANPVQKFCKLLDGHTLFENDQKQLLTKLGHALSTVYANYTGKVKCMKIVDPAAELPGWDFQACTEMVMPSCSKESDIFETQEWNFGNFEKNCFSKFGVNITNPNLAVSEYGGNNIKAASNIVFSNGLLDPWSGGGVLSNVSESVSAIIIPEGAHHLDLRGFNKNDPLSVISARKFHVASIRKWLRNYYLTNYKEYSTKRLSNVILA